MQDRDRGNVGEGQKQTRPFRTIISSIIWRYCLLCGGVAVASGYIVLVGTLAEEFSEKIIRNVSFILAFLAALALVVGVPVIALSGFIQSKTSGDVSRIGARIFSDIIVGSFALLLLLVLLAFGILLLQLSTGQFLLGEEETQYRHLMMLSAYAGALFGVAAGWKGKSSHGLGLAASIWHGTRVFVETAFLAYAGLWLSKEPFRYFISQAEAKNWELTVISMLGMALIFVGSLSLMGRQAQVPPPQQDISEQIPFRVRVRLWVQYIKEIYLRVVDFLRRSVSKYWR